MPLFVIILLKETNFLSDNTMEVISEYGDYYFSQEGMYLRMYGCSIAPSLPPKYAMNYVVHKAAVRKVLLNGVGNFLHDMKKATFPPLPLCIDGYKFSKVKGAEDFVKELETFHFGENFFEINDSKGKVTEHCAAVKIHYEYSDLFNMDEEVFRRANNLIELGKRFSKKSGVIGSKDGSTTMEIKLQKQKEEALRL